VSIDPAIDNYRRTAPQKPAREERAADYTARTAGMSDWIMGAVQNAHAEDRSAEFFKVVRALKGSGWSAGEIETLFADHPDGIASKYWNRLRQEVDRAYDKADERVRDPREKFFREARQEKPAAVEITTRRASDIKPEPIDWLWKYYLARGKLHILAGAPEAGKTTIALSYAAIVSSGDKWPDETLANAGNVLIWSSEDDAADTLIPRLIRMGANLDRIHIVEETRPPGMKSRPFNPATDLDALVAKAKTINGGVALFIIDSVVSAVPMTRNSHNNAETRNGLQPVVDFAKATDAATLGISHLTKGTIGKDPLERLAGSLAFGALPRLVMFAAKNNAEGDDEPERIMIRVKSNIGPSGGGFGYHIDIALLLEQPDVEATRIAWELPLKGTARELLADAEGEEAKDGPRDRAKHFLREKLAGGKQMQKAIQAEADLAGIAWATVRRASSEMKMRKWQEGKRSWWELPI
jgi:putative DNA primase/helicase